MRRAHNPGRLLTHFAVHVLALLWLSAPLRAEETLPDVRLLIDVSGSMRESDPKAQPA